MAAKLIVTTTKGGSRISLVGTSGTELLSSKVFTEPRAKGATLRSLKGLLGDDVVIEDQTVSAGRKPAEIATAPAARRAVASGRKAAVSTPARASRNSRSSATKEVENVPTTAPAKAPAARRKAATANAPAATRNGATKRSPRTGAPAKKVTAKKATKATRAAKAG